MLSEKDWRFLFVTAAFSLLFLALLHVLKPVIAPDPRQDEINALTGRILTVSAAEAETLISRGDKPAMLVVYASWCGYCRQMMPDIAVLLADPRYGALRPVFLSRDSENGKLAAYLLYSRLDRLFTPYILPSAEMRPLRKMLAAHGASFTGGIPYVAFFDREGRLRGELNGLADGKTLMEAASLALPNMR